MRLNKNIMQRLSSIEQILDSKKDYIFMLSIYNDEDNNYYIIYITNGKRTDYIYDKLEDFYRDKKINKKDKHTFIKNYTICKPTKEV